MDSTSSHPLRPQDVAALDALPATAAFLADDYEKGFHKGIQLYLSVDGEPVADLAYGAVGEQPLTTNSLLHWVCASKPVTTVAIGLLAEQGLVDFADRVTDYVPEYGKGGKEEARLEHLLTHSMPHQDRRTQYNLGLGWEENLELACATEVDAPPGAHRAYATWINAQVLAEVVARVSGTTFDDFVTRNVLHPLGMRDTWFGMTREDYEKVGDSILPMTFADANMRHGYGEHSKNAYDGLINVYPQVRMASLPSSGAKGPMRDLAKLYETLAGTRTAEGSAVDWTSVAARLTEHHEVDEPIAPDGAWYGDWAINDMDWSHGFLRDRGMFCQEASPLVFGHPGEKVIMALGDPGHGLAMAFSFNSIVDPAFGNPRMNLLCRALYQDALG
ncbi:serine hydrolase domain-containing protein [Lentzea flaviverrucosa]|uniref:CubicO group peptidase, beta-lactamase class C family n=1 Tax=Lentzea flaviverrucosa TaxID=200379 RepID=A0A1H9WTT7_9PSEU|nr:serine hydrolase domain-containing protein [Lentzea flaviverrucosa]RDI23091.1 CubicO group peptidase (beta-lactamase class C family) [Lentzea flaviverrucosa]SES37244.1 CubicO group peptidase, beta-lactamase class C family [Lentzea flaviverrucosa]